MVHNLQFAFHLGDLVLGLDQVLAVQVAITAHSFVQILPIKYTSYTSSSSAFTYSNEKKKKKEKENQEQQQQKNCIKLTQRWTEVSKGVFYSIFPTKQTDVLLRGVRNKLPKLSLPSMYSRDVITFFSRCTGGEG